ncbi:multiple sugar transport system permease protein [Kineothrix alysoides]|uniref:Multiple sugar transport system permease protein n=1 Tax=Kineothrix alysoides TaxID=1469948 RepID=A0A4R1QLD3_9FIRM|nr:sugar ABC transporter permease [Kineothrix alysoides]TCL54436.1 multiple sugar transport system permease protein [Kineothrix alysoides]
MAKPAKQKRKTVEYGRYGYYFIAPFFIVFAIFQLWPLIYTIGLAFCENYTDTMFNVEVGPVFNGIENFKTVFIGKDGTLFNTYTFQSLWNTILMWLMNFVPQILLALVLAIWFTDTRVKMKAQGAYKIMTFMPNIITAATISVLFYSLFNYPNGPVNQFLLESGLLSQPYRFFQQKWATRGIISFINFWMWYGNTMVVLTAGVLGISPSLFEAARVDGASSFQIFKKITLPLLRPILLFTLVNSAIGGLQMFDIPKLLTTSGYGDPDYTTRTITMYMRELAFTGAKQMGKASATSVVLFVVTLFFSLVLFYIMRDKDAIRERKQNKAIQKEIARKGAK